MTKAEFLTRLRKRLSVPIPENLPHPLVKVPEVPRVRWVDTPDNPVPDFVDAATAVGTIVHRLRGSAGLDAFLWEVVRANQVKTAVVSEDPETAGVYSRLSALGVEVRTFDSFHNPARSDIGVTGALWGIAATGTLVLHSRRAGGRSVGLLPPVHVALLEADRILNASEDLFRQMGQRMAGGMPSQLVLATGPSRSGDIELEITVGVHGPKQVWVGIIE